MTRRLVSVAIVFALALVAPPLLGAAEQTEPPVAASDSLHAETPRTLERLVATLGRVRLHPARDAAEVGVTTASRESDSDE